MTAMMSPALDLDAPSPTGPVEPSDNDLLGLVARGDHDAFAQLYDRYSQLALAVAYRVLDDHGAAEDAVQAAFLSIWNHADAFQIGRGTARAWMLTITRNAAIDRRRGRLGLARQDAALDEVAFQLAADEHDAFIQVVARIEAARVREALGHIPHRQREAIELAFFSGLTCAEIADRTQSPLGTVKGRLRLGLLKLRDALADLAPPPVAVDVAA